MITFLIENIQKILGWILLVIALAVLAGQTIYKTIKKAK